MIRHIAFNGVYYVSALLNLTVLVIIVFCVKAAPPCFCDNIVLPALIILALLWGISVFARISQQ